MDKKQVIGWAVKKGLELLAAFLAGRYGYDLVKGAGVPLPDLAEAVTLIVLAAGSIWVTVKGRKKLALAPPPNQGGSVQ